MPKQTGKPIGRDYRATISRIVVQFVRFGDEKYCEWGFGFKSQLPTSTTSAGVAREIAKIGGRDTDMKKANYIRLLKKKIAEDFSRARGR